MEKTIASITKPKDEELKERLSAAREKLATLQIKVKEAKLPVLVLFEGFGAAGKGSVLSKIIKNMDPRFFHVETMDQPEPTELRKPFLYRYFKRIPENGQFTFMDGGWMEEIVRDRVHEQLDEEAFGKKICSIKRFERTLSDNGYTILKFFFYIDENEQFRQPFLQLFELLLIFFLGKFLVQIHIRKLRDWRKREQIRQDRYCTSTVCKRSLNILIDTL